MGDDSYVTCSPIGLQEAILLVIAQIQDAKISLTVSKLNFRKGLSCKESLLVMKCIIPIANAVFRQNLLHHWEKDN